MKKWNQKRLLAMLLCWTMLLTNLCLPALSEETKVPSCVHTSTETHEEAGAAATCTADGSHTVITVCADCGHELSRSTVADAALGHAYSVYSEAPTCTEAGKVVYTCSRCGDTYTEAGEAALGHDYHETARTEVSCSQAGSVTYACSRCGDTYTEACVAALGHDYQETTRTEATWDAEGSVTYICSRCEDSYHQILPRLEKPEEPEQPEEPERPEEPEQPEQPDELGQPEDPESPAVPFEQIETVDDVKITVTALAGVFDADAKLTISKTGNSDFTGAAQNALDIKAGDRIIIRHAVYSFSGAEMNGNAQVKLEKMALTDLLEANPEGTVSVYVLRYDANAQNAADQAKRVSADVNVDGNSISFGLSALGLYDVVTVVRLPERTEATTENPGEEPAEEPGEELSPSADPEETTVSESAEALLEAPAEEIPAEPAAAPETVEQADLADDCEPEIESEPLAVTISASYEGELHYGSTVTLTAVLSVDEPAAVVTWEYSPDGGHTVFVVEDEHSNTLTYTFSEDTKDYSWRVAVNRAPVD